MVVVRGRSSEGERKRSIREENRKPRSTARHPPRPVISTRTHATQCAQALLPSRRAGRKGHSPKVLCEAYFEVAVATSLEVRVPKHGAVEIEVRRYTRAREEQTATMCGVRVRGPDNCAGSAWQEQARNFAREACVVVQRSEMAPGMCSYSQHWNWCRVCWECAAAEPTTAARH